VYDVEGDAPQKYLEVPRKSIDGGETEGGVLRCGDGTNPSLLTNQSIKGPCPEFTTQHVCGHPAYSSHA
jgi:hypothetical protein